MQELEGELMQKKFGFKNKFGYKPVKKYKNFILFEKLVNGKALHECFNYCDLPLTLTEEDKRWIERN